MNEIRITWLMATKIWWSYTWRVLLIVLPLAFAFGFVAGIALALAKQDVQEYMLALNIAGGVIGIAGAIFTFKLIFQKRFSGYRLAILPVTPSTDTTENMQA